MGFHVLQFHSPTSPDEMDWSTMYPAFFNNQDDSGQKPMVEFADIGCGYGGLLGNCGYNINNTNKPKYST